MPDLNDYHAFTSTSGGSSGGRGGGCSSGCEPWISLGGNTHVAYGVCPDGDEFLVQLSVVYHQRREYSTKRIIFEMSDDLWDIYMDKKEALGA